MEFSEAESNAHDLILLAHVVLTQAPSSEYQQYQEATMEPEEYEDEEFAEEEIPYQEEYAEEAPIEDAPVEEEEEEL
ncbi:hypothetical protein EIP86_007193 [Pleurotus ostreatoroseus]|nr:hypothetical protein EIP86_007193 [Pleurotus ostreatoroseus]